MKRVPFGMILAKDEATGSLFPWLQKTLARLVVFPDGKDLWTHWQKEINGANRATFRKEQTELGNDTFNWETNTFGVDNAVLKLHTVMSIPTQASGQNQYVYKIKLPTQFIPSGRTLDYEDAGFSILERENSTFIRKHCMHNIYIDVVNTELRVTVDHLKSIDGVNLGNESYITGSFDITCNIAFNSYA